MSVSPVTLALEQSQGSQDGFAEDTQLQTATQDARGRQFQQRASVGNGCAPGGNGGFGDTEEAVCLGCRWEGGEFIIE